MLFSLTVSKKIYFFEISSFALRKQQRIFFRKSAKIKPLLLVDEVAKNAPTAFTVVENVTDVKDKKKTKIFYYENRF